MVNFVTSWISLRNLKKSDPIEEMEIVTKKCPKLRKIDVKNTVDLHRIYYMDEEDIPKVCTPRPDIHTLRIGRDYVLTSPTLLTYIMHKFPNLKAFDLGVPGWEIEDKSKLDHLFSYLAKIREINIGSLMTEANFVCDSVRSYLEETRFQQPELLTSICLECEVGPLCERDLSTFYLQRSASTRKASLTLPISGGNDFKNPDLLIQHGEFVGDLEFCMYSRDYMRFYSSEQGDTLLEKLIVLSFTLCGNLKTLKLNRCFVHCIKKAYLHKLIFDCCDISELVFGTFFGSIDHISLLHLEGCIHLDKYDEETPFARISMPNTIIGTVSIVDPTIYDY